MGRKAKKAAAQDAAAIAAQSQAAEEAEIQRAFEQGITTLRDLISLAVSKSILVTSVSAQSTVAQFMSTVTPVLSIRAGSPA